MAMDFVVAIAAKIGEYLVAPIGRELGYLIHYNKNVENLRKQVQSLIESRQGVQGSVQAARRNGEEIKADVEKWLTSVEGVTSEVEMFLGDDVKFNKKCFSGGCPDWDSRYRLSKEAKKKSLILIEHREDGKFDSVSFPAPPPGIESIPAGDFEAFESTESTMEEIMEALKDAETNMVGVYGMGGVGKTTLVKKVGKWAKEDKLFDEVVMAVVSQTQNLRDIQGQIADRLGLKFDVETEPGRADRLRSRLMNEKRILVILDDVWEKLNLDAVGIPFGDDHKGCKIVLTTRRQEVCYKIGIQTKAIPLNVLSEDDSWNFFRKYAGQAVDSPPLNVVAREVAKYCGGLPMALVTVGRALGDEDIKEWKKAASRLKEFKATHNEDVDQDVFSCLKLSYDYVKGEETKSCFLLCCLFPEDHDIDIQVLVRYGMGQGLFQNEETIEEARGITHTAIKSLKASCLLLDGYKEGFVKMHDVVRHAAISIASKDKHMWVRSGVSLKEWPNKPTFKDRVISLMYNIIQKLPNELECPKLETLLLQENDLHFAPEAFFKGMEALRVLDLSGQLFLGYDLPASFGSLKNLRTLHLNNLMFKDISILGELKELEILSLFGSRIKELPREIGKLTKLRLLDMTSCVIGNIPPNVISSLSKLEELYMRGSSNNWKVAELNSLGCLTILSLEILDVECLPKDLRLPNLKRFNISAGYIIDIIDYPTSKTMYLSNSKFPLADAIEGLLENTEMLYLRNVKGLNNNLLDINGLKESCHGLSLPSQSFQNLKVMVVEWCDILLNVGPANLLQRLQNLEELEIRNCHALEIVFNLEGKWLVEEKNIVLQPYRLRELRLNGLPGLMHIWKGPNHIVSFENLKVVSVKRCERLRNIFSPALATSLLQLEKLEISNCSGFKGIVSKEEDQVEQEDSNRNVVLTFPNLKILKVERCPVLRNLFSSTLARGGLPQLRELSIEWCSELEEIIAKEDEEEKTSYLKGLHRPPICLDNLKFLKIDGCNLKCLFSFTLAQGHPRLEKLEISYCCNLEEIVAKEKDGHKEDKKIGIWRKDLCAFNTGPACFENLKILNVEFCSKLKNIFSPSIAQCLGFQLEVLRIVYCDFMEDVVSKEKEGEEVMGKIVFPKLKTIDLFSLHGLRSFCSGNFSFEWPSLEQVLLSDCPQMETFTAAALGIRSTPKLKKITLDGEKILSMDLNTVIQNRFKGERKVDEDDESTSESEIQEVLSKSKGESTPISQIQKVLHYKLLLNLPNVLVAKED
ncbi:hypothetical protein HHK36_023834 [Tetracentron sinense]|uniref:AAA+ ATPase domain-containing protein n=1 Tax=Tetracentron sinense TaxID=13715 RepID=A0A834YM05_TETSI|nr:hypothetical protein HHK36_023834 [Tetracentron sinense]